MTTRAALDPACRLVVAVPARNEAGTIADALEAFAQQLDADGEPLDPRAFELLVFCNGCDDDTANVARRFAAAHPALRVTVVETPADACSNVGFARRAALDEAVARFEAAGRTDGIVATTDADTLVERTWVAATLDDMRVADAVGGFVRIAPDACERMLAPLRLAYDREVTYRQLLGAVEDRFDPRAHDPWPRHDALVGASFAVSARAYEAAGRLPTLALHEDVAFARALERIDARVRHSMRVRAFTSARMTSRVEGGFATFVADLARHSAERRSVTVRSGDASIEWARARGYLRRALRGDAPGPRLAAASRVLGVSASRLRRLASSATTFGAFWLDLEPETRQARYADVPVEAALVTLRGALAASSAPRPTRARAASGAG